MLLSRGGTVLGARIGQAVLNAGVGWLVARELGPGGQGYYSLSLLVIVFLASFCNGGMGLAAVPVLRREPRLIPAMVRAQLSWVVMIAVAVSLGWLIGSRWGLQSMVSANLSWDSHALVAALVAVPALILFDVMVFDHTALGRVTFGPLVNTGRAAVLLSLLTLLLLIDRFSLAGVLGAYALAQLGAAVVVWLRIPRSRPSETVARGTFPLIATTLGAGWVGQLSTVVSTLHLRLDLALIAYWHDPEIVGFYSVAVLIGELLWMLPGALQPVLVYTAGDPHNPRRRDATTARAVRVGLLVTAAGAVAIAVVARPVFRLLFSGRFDASVPALWALLPGIVIFAAGAVLAGDFIGRGRPRWNTQASLLTLVANLTAGVLLIPRHGAVGAAWASSLAYVCGSLAMLWRFRRVSGLGWTAMLILRRDDFRRH